MGNRPDQGPHELGQHVPEQGRDAHPVAPRGRQEWRAAWCSSGAPFHQQEDRRLGEEAQAQGGDAAEFEHLAEVFH